MLQHRPNSPAAIPDAKILPADLLLCGASSSGRRAGQHRAAKNSSASATTVAGATVALAGAIGLAAGGAAQAAAHPSTPTTDYKTDPALSTLRSLATLPGVEDLTAHAQDLATHADLSASIDKALQDLQTPATQSLPPPPTLEAPGSAPGGAPASAPSGAAPAPADDPMKAVLEALQREQQQKK